MALSGLMAASVLWQLGPNTLVAAAEEIADEEAIVTEVIETEETGAESNASDTEYSGDAAASDAETSDVEIIENSTPEDSDSEQYTQEDAERADDIDDIVGAGEETDTPLMIDGQEVVDISAELATKVIYYGVDAEDYFVANSKYVFSLKDGSTTTLYTNVYAQNLYRANGEIYNDWQASDYVNVGCQLYDEISADEAETKKAANEYVYEDNGRYFVPSDGDYSKPSNMKYEAGDYYIRVGFYQGGLRRYSMPMMKVSVVDPQTADIARYTLAQALAGIPYSTNQIYPETNLCYAEPLIAITGTKAGYGYFNWYTGPNSYRTLGTNIVADGDAIYFRASVYAQVDSMVFAEVKPISSITYESDKPITLYEGVRGETSAYLISRNVDSSLFKVLYTDGTTDTLDSFSDFWSSYQILDSTGKEFCDSVPVGSYIIKFSAPFWLDDDGYFKYYSAPVEVKPFSKLAEDAGKLAIGDVVSLARKELLYYYAIQLEGDTDYCVYMDEETHMTPYMYLYDGKGEKVLTTPSHIYNSVYTFSVAESGTYYLALETPVDNCKFAVNLAPALEQYDGLDIKSVEFDIPDNTVIYGFNTYRSLMAFNRIDITLSDASHRYLYFYNLYDLTQLMESGINGGFSDGDYYLDVKICVRASGNEGVTLAVDAQGNRYIEATQVSDFDGSDWSKQYSVGTYYIVARFYQQNDSGDTLYYSDNLITSFEIVDPANYAGAVTLEEAASGITYDFYDEYPEIQDSKNTHYVVVKGLTPGKIYEFKISNEYRTDAFSKIAQNDYEIIELSYYDLYSDSVVLCVSEVTNPIKGLSYSMNFHKCYPIFYHLPNRDDHYLKDLLRAYRYELTLEDGSVVSCDYTDSLRMGYFYDSNGVKYDYDKDDNFPPGEYTSVVTYYAGVNAQGANPSVTVPVTLKSFDDLATDLETIVFDEKCILDKQVENYVKVEIEGGKKYSYVISGSQNVEVTIYSESKQQRVCTDDHFGYAANFMVEESGTYYLVIYHHEMRDAEVSIVVSEPDGLRVDGKKLVDIDAYFPNSVLYKNIDYSYIGFDGVRFRLIYEDSEEYAYLNFSMGNCLCRIVDNDFESTDLSYENYYVVKTNKTPEEADPYEDYVDSDGTVYTYINSDQIYSEDVAQDSVYALFKFYTYKNGLTTQFDKAILSPVQIRNVADDATVQGIEIGQSTNVALRGYVYDETDKIKYRTVFRINGSKKGYIYGYEFIIMNGADEIYHTSDYFCAKSDNTGIVLSGYPIGDYQRIVKVIEYAPMEKVEYVPAQGDVKPVYYYGIDGIGGSYYYTKYDNLFRLYARYKITYKSGEIKYVTYNDLHEYLGYASSSVCDSEGKYISDAEQRSLEVGNYFYRVYIGAWLDEVTEESKYIDIPFEVKPASELANDADTLALNQPVAISGYNRGGQYIYFKSYLAAGSTYVLKSTDGYYWAEMYDLGGNLVKDMFNDNRDGEITVTKSGEYIFVINEVQEYYSNRPVVVTLKKQPQIVRAWHDTTIPYRSLFYKGIDSYSNVLRPKGACINIEFDDETKKTIRIDDYNNYSEYTDFIGTYVDKIEWVTPSGNVSYDYEVAWDELTAGSCTEAGTYQFKMYFKNVDEPVAIPVEVRDPAQAEELAVGSTVEIKYGGLYFDRYPESGIPNVYKVSLEKDKIYKFKLSEPWTTVYMTLWDTEGNAVVPFEYEEYYFEDGTQLYEKTVNSISYKAEKTGIYYLCIETSYDFGMEIVAEEIIPITKIELDTTRPYVDTVYTGIPMSYSPTGVTLDVYYADGTVEKCQYANNANMSKIRDWTIVDAKGEALGKFVNFESAGQYYYALTIDGYDGCFNVPLTVKSIESAVTVSEGYEGVNVNAAVIPFIDGGRGTGNPAVYKFELQAGRSYFFKCDSYLDNSGIFEDEMRFYLMDSNLNIVANGDHMTYGTNGYNTSFYSYMEYMYTPTVSGTYYAYISNYAEEDFRFSFYEVPQLVAAEIISQPAKTVYFERIDDIQYGWSMGLAVRLSFIDGTEIIAHANDIGKYGFKTYLVDEYGRHEQGNMDYYSYPCGKYVVSFVNENSDIELNTIELSVVEPKTEVITLNEKVSVITSEDDCKLIDLGQGRENYMYVGDTKLYEIILTEAAEYQINVDKPVNIEIRDEVYNYVNNTGYYSDTDIMYFEGRPGKYYIRIVSKVPEAEFVVSKAVKITKAEIITQPIYVTKGLSAEEGPYYMAPAGIQIKLTYADGSLKTLNYNDSYWTYVVNNVRLYSTTEKKYVHNSTYGNGCYYTVTKNDTLYFEIVMNSKVCVTEKLTTANFKVTTDLYTNSNRAITTAYSTANPYVETMYYYEYNAYTIKTEKGKRYQLIVEGSNANVLLVTEENGNIADTSVVYSTTDASGVSRCFIDGIAASEGIYTLWLNPNDYNADGSYTVKISLVECNASAEYEGMSVTLVDGKVRVNAYYSITDTANIGKYVNYIGRMQCDAPVAETVVINGVSKNVYRFSAFVAPDELNEALDCTLEYDDAQLNVRRISVYEYAKVIIENKGNNPEYTKSKDMLNALLNYGEYMEKYFVTSNLSDPKISYLATADKVYTTNSFNLNTSKEASFKDSESFKYLGASLVLHENIVLKLYLSNNAHVDKDTFMNSYRVSVDGVEGDDRLEVEVFDSYIVVSLYDIDVRKLSTSYTFDIVNKSKTSDAAKIVYSPMNYVAEVLNHQSDYSFSFVNLCKALYVYMDEAKKYAA